MDRKATATPTSSIDTSRRDGAWKRLNLTDYERTRAKAYSIMPVDVSEEELIERRRERERIRKALKRREERAKPRRIYEREAATRTQPWKALGISRRTYYRRLEAGEPRGTSPSAMKLRSLAPDTPVPRSVGGQGTHGSY